MKDQGNSDQIERDPQAPKYMRPRRPVLDEPLEEEASQQASGEVETSEVQTDEPERFAEDTQEVKLMQEGDGQVEPLEDETQFVQTEVQSPYFPHGIYEDAQSVEAYYGRGEAGEDQDLSPERAVKPEDAGGGRQVHWLILIFAILMILVLLFLTLTEGIPAGFF